MYTYSILSSHSHILSPFNNPPTKTASGSLIIAWRQISCCLCWKVTQVGMPMATTRIGESRNWTSQVSLWIDQVSQEMYINIMYKYIYIYYITSYFKYMVCIHMIIYTYIIYVYVLQELNQSSNRFLLFEKYTPVHESSVAWRSCWSMARFSRGTRGTVDTREKTQGSYNKGPILGGIEQSQI